MPIYNEDGTTACARCGTCGGVMCNCCTMMLVDKRNCPECEEWYQSSKIPPRAVADYDAIRAIVDQNKTRQKRSE